VVVETLNDFLRIVGDGARVLGVLVVVGAVGL
jgi:hypothetical protein